MMSVDLPSFFSVFLACHHPFLAPSVSRPSALGIYLPALGKRRLSDLPPIPTSPPVPWSWNIPSYRYLSALLRRPFIDHLSPRIFLPITQSYTSHTVSCPAFLYATPLLPAVVTKLHLLNDEDHPNVFPIGVSMLAHEIHVRFETPLDVSLFFHGP